MIVQKRQHHLNILCHFALSLAFSVTLKYAKKFSLSIYGVLSSAQILIFCCEYFASDCEKTVLCLMDI